MKENSYWHIGADFLLFLIFLALKLTGTIHWSWWWVTAPLWIGLAIVLVILILAVLVGTLVGIFKAMADSCK